MSIASVLIANRGEIAVRIARTAADIGVRTVAVFSEDDDTSLHRHGADDAVGLKGTGARAYLDIAQLVDAAVSTGCDALHPGYGFVSENADLARRCEEAGIIFVGPQPEVLELFGDKVAARLAASQVGVPVLAGSPAATTLAEAEAFFNANGPLMLKALAGGGGRGMRTVRSLEELGDVYERCRSEAQAGFANPDLFVEQLVERPRHVEVQILGDGSGAVVHFGERDCSIQRRHQKLVEIAPAPNLAAGVRERLHEAAVKLAESATYRNAGTFEFLVDAADSTDDAAFWFIEANPRLQVEHTVTEEVTGIDLVEAQLRIAGGARLEELGLGSPPPLTGMAMQVRINMETMQPDGSVLPSGGVLDTFEMASGRGVRVDSFGYAGYRTSPSFDSLLAKLITWRRSETLAELAPVAQRALNETHIEGVATNTGFLTNLVSHPAFVGGDLHTGFVEDHLDSLVTSESDHRPRYVVVDHNETGTQGRAGAQVDASDPLAVLNYGRSASPAGESSGSGASSSEHGADGAAVVASPLQGTVIEVTVAAGDIVRPGQVVAVMESMKMEHEITTSVGGIVRRVNVLVGDTLFADHALLFVDEQQVDGGAEEDDEVVDLDHIREDLAEIVQRHEMVMDEARPEAVARRRATNKRMARENVADLVDDDTFIEYGPMVVAAQKRRRTMEDLLVRSPADGLITGVGSVNGDLFDDPDSRCAVMAYDYTVFAGTQGIKNHAKTDRILQVAGEGRMPFILFGEGGGGRPGDTDGGDHGTWTFAHFAGLSGLVPMVGITTGFCYAGNASILGCCDVIIATEGSNIGMGGPAMVEGGGLGVFAPEEIGPMDVQVASGVVDIEVKDEVEAVQVAKKYLSYFQGRVDHWEEHDQRKMRPIVPENRLRVYEIREVIETLADVDSVLELRRGFGAGMVTSLIRIEGRPVGVVANDPKHLGGAIDSDGSDKGARFMQLCDAFDIPLLFLCDTPGIMVGPEIERTALVRKSSRMFLIGANVTVPSFCILVRKAYGLGCIAMAGASFKKPLATVAWPTAEFGPMGLEGAVKLGFRDELAALEDPEERVALYDKLVAQQYARGKAERQATGFAVDDAIDPADSRRWMANLLASIRPPAEREGKKSPYIDAW